jgi:hypothetical protein
MRIAKFLMVQVGEAEVIPRGYGLAYWDFARAEGIFYLIPFNLIVRFAHWFYWAIARDFYPNKFERLLRQEWHRGYRAGHQDGFKEGERKGRVNAIREIGERFDKYLSLPMEEREQYVSSWSKQHKENDH